MEADARALPSLVVLTPAVLSTEPQVAGVVGEEMCTVLVAPGPRFPKLQVRVPEEMEHWAAPVPPSIDQESPGFLGSVSDTWALVAIPSPELVTVMRNPMLSPALTESWSAFLSMAM